MLRDRRILITGGARGLGRKFAEAVVGVGARVAIADILEEDGRAAAKALGATFVSFDLVLSVSIDACVGKAVAVLGGLDGLVNNGVITSFGGKSLDELDIDVWDRVMSVNVRGTWLATRAASGHLRAVGAGRVINIVSDTAL